MAELKHFSPRSELTAAANLAEFVRMCRQDLSVFGENLKWEDTVWPKAANFTKLGAPSRGHKEGDRLDDAFIDFAKAYFRYQQGHRPTGTKNESKALRAIEAALLQVRTRAQITDLDVAILDEAAQLGKSHYSPIAAYHCGRELQRLATFLSARQLIDRDLSTWKSPIEKPLDGTIQTGSQARALREKKLPSQEALDALAEMFANNPSEPRDVFITSAFAMTMCAPVRISEILELQVDCEVEETDSQGVTQYGWRFFSAKGFEGDIKWIPAVMVPVAKEAIRRIRSMTDESRKLAAWMEEHPNVFYPHNDCPIVSNEQPLTPEDAARAIGQPDLAQTGLSQKHGAHTLNSLWQYIMPKQPAGFPWVSKIKKIKYSGALFCMSKNLLHSVKRTIPVILWMPDANTFNNMLSPRDYESTQGHKSIFDRYGYRSESGDRIKLTSHQARHLITTLANRGGLSQEEIAKWAGRADAKQNRTYNHMSEWEMVAKAEALDTALTMFGPSGEVSQHVPITAQDLDLMERGPMHVSVWGVCSHDFIMSPCEKYRDCLNCEEHVCIKGQSGEPAERLERIKNRLAQVQIDFEAAKEGMSNGYIGADRWYEYHEKTVVRLRQLVEILESTQVPEGAQIKLRDGNDFSHLRRVIRLKAVEAIGSNTRNAAMLSDMKKLLGENRG